jgi:hypothetical protein
LEIWIFTIAIFTFDGTLIDLEVIDNFKSEKSCVFFSENNFNENILGNKVTVKKTCTLKQEKQKIFKPHPLLRVNKPL